MLIDEFNELMLLTSYLSVDTQDDTLAPRPQAKGTDTTDNRAKEQDAHGVSEAMMNVYDKSVPTVKPSA